MAVTKNIRKLIAAFLSANMFLMNLPASVLASNITGITPNGNTYNIEAAKVSGDTGFRQYANFDLSKNDIANLIYKDYSKFVNLVDSQININGSFQNSIMPAFNYSRNNVFISFFGYIRNNTFSVQNLQKFRE